MSKDTAVQLRNPVADRLARKGNRPELGGQRNSRKVVNFDGASTPRLPILANGAALSPLLGHDQVVIGEHVVKQQSGQAIKRRHQLTTLCATRAITIDFDLRTAAYGD